MVDYEALRFLQNCVRWLTPVKPGLLPSYDVRTFILRVLSNVLTFRPPTPFPGFFSSWP